MTCLARLIVRPARARGGAGPRCMRLLERPAVSVVGHRVTVPGALPLPVARVILHDPVTPPRCAAVRRGGPNA
jgi:hypothetical protein